MDSASYYYDHKRVVHSENYKGHRIVIYEEHVHTLILGLPSPNYSRRSIIEIDGIERPNNVGNLSSDPKDDARVILDWMIETDQFRPFEHD